ncbi:MAG: 3-keto-disaccharide hydrolase [Lacipirellulaceae bacterium]
MASLIRFLNPVYGLLVAIAVSPLAASANPSTEGAEAGGWVPLFNGTDFTGWKANERPETFKIAGGLIVANGDRSHLYYVGDVEGAEFQDFDLLVEVMTEPNSNSGIYFHTKYQDEGWPTQGYEVQVNQTQGDTRKTGGLYAIADVMDKSPVNDNQWYTQEVSVRGKHVILRVNGTVTTDYTEPDGVKREANLAGRLLSKGTFALQGHDPGSTVRYRKVWVRPVH